jgi:adenine-specific DNA-methyltransferase
VYRYIGNKSRLAPWLVTRVREHAARGMTVADLMCGTGSVSEALRASGYRVIACDMMTFAAQHAQVRLLLDDAPSFVGLDANYRAVIGQLNDLKPEPGLFFREYSPEGRPLSGTDARRYLTGENAAKLDAINNRLRHWAACGAITPIENSLLRHDLVLAVNRIANIAGTYGHYRSSFSKAAMAPLALSPSKFLAGYRTDHVVLQGKAEELAHKLSADVCYIDPPYMKRQYAANYHLIETVARGDEPEAVGISGLRPWRDQYSVFCTRTRIQNAFREIISTMDCPTFLISYSSDGLLSEEELTDVFNPVGEISFERRPYPRFRSNQSNLGPLVTELLITIRKRQSGSAHARSA